jgi:L-fuconolactonase
MGLRSSRIDAHQHFWRYDPARDSWITGEMAVLRKNYLPEDLLPELESHQMDGSIAVQASQSDEETCFLLELAQRYPCIAGVVGWINLSAANLADRLESYSRFEKLRGFRHIVQSEADDRFLLREEIICGIRVLGQFGFTYDLLIYPRQLPAALELTQRLPDQRFVIDHIAKPPIQAGQMEPWTKYIREIAANPSVYCKVSGLVTEADWRAWKTGDFLPYLNVVWETFGPDRLLFGSDWPVCLLAGTYSQVMQLVAEYVSGWPARDQEAFFGGNASRFYGLKACSHGSAA